MIFGHDNRAWGWAMCKYVGRLFPGEGIAIYWEVLCSRS